MIRGLISLVALGGLLLQLSTAWAGTGPHFDEGVRLLKRFEFEAAQRAFEEALQWPGNSRADRAMVLVHIGIAQSNQNDYQGAEASFQRALAESPEVKLPPRTSPKIRALFEKVQAEARAAAPPASPAPETTAAPEPVPEAAVSEDDAIPPSPRPSAARWPAWTMLGVAVAAGGTGLAMGLLNLSEKSRAEDRSLPYSEAQQHADGAATRGLAANILFGVAGAAAVTSGILFYFGYRKPPPASASIAPIRSGFMVQLEARR